MTDPNFADAINSAGNMMSRHSRDWGEDHRDAWVYGIIVGWDSEALKEVAARHSWTPETVSSLRMLRAKAERMSSVSELPPGWTMPTPGRAEYIWIKKSDMTERVHAWVDVRDGKVRQWNRFDGCCPSQVVEACIAAARKVGIK